MQGVVRCSREKCANGCYLCMHVCLRYCRRHGTTPTSDPFSPAPHEMKLLTDIVGPYETRDPQTRDTAAHNVSAPTSTRAHADPPDFLELQVIRAEPAQVPRGRVFREDITWIWSRFCPASVAMGGVSGAGILKPLAGASPGCVLGAVYLLVGSALGAVAVLHASESEVGGGGEWASAARGAAAALARSVGAHHLLLPSVISLLFLAASVWRLGRRYDAVEGLVRNAVQALRVGGVVCAVCGSKMQALKRARLSSSSSEGRADKPVSWSLAADKAEEDNFGEVSDPEEGNVQWQRKRLKEEKVFKEVALEELEKEARAMASAADEAMAKIACLRREKALVEREVKQFREMAQQKQLYDRQVIQSLHWVITRSGIQCWEPEALSDRAVSRG
jgi:hypothetical protein